MKPVQETQGRLVQHKDFSNPRLAQMEESDRRRKLDPELTRTQKIPAVPMAQEVYGQTEE